MSEPEHRGLRTAAREAEEAAAETERGKATPALRRYRRWRKYRRLLWLLMLVPVGYVAVQLFIILAPRMRTEVVLGDTMTESLTVTGQVVMNSTPVTGAAPYIYYTVPAGQRVSVGAEVAQQYSGAAAVQAGDRLAAIERELAMLTEAQGATAEGGDLDILLEELRTGVYDVLSHMESGDYADIGAAFNETTLAANRLQVATRQSGGFEQRITSLKTQQAQYEALAVPTGSITAPVTGYFVPAMREDRVQPPYDDIAALTPAQLSEALAAEPAYHAADVAGHIITDYRWYFFTVVDMEHAEKFIEGDSSLTLTFPQAGGESIPVTVNRVRADEGAGIALVELYCEYISPDTMTLRVETAQIVFGVQKGLRVEKSALRLVDVAQDGGLVTTYGGVYVQLGNMVYFRRVRVLAEDEFYMLVSDVYEDGVSELQMYDKVVVDSGGVELYDRKIL